MIKWHKIEDNDYPQNSNGKRYIVSTKSGVITAATFRMTINKPSFYNDSLQCGLSLSEVKYWISFDELKKSIPKD